MAGIAHGGALDRAIAEFGGQKAHWLDLSTGINPNPYPVPVVPEDIWHRLPDEALLENCLAAAHAYYNVPKGMCIVAAPGTQALIELLPDIIESDTASILSPTYSEHAHCWAKAGKHVEAVANINDAKSKALVVVNPNNPNGKIYSPEVLQQHGGPLIVDEAFGDVAPELCFAPHLGSDTIVLKSFGKFFGLAGLRLGFAIAPQAVADQIEEKLGPWAVAGPALFIGAQALLDKAWIESTRRQLSAQRISLQEMLTAKGFTIVGATDLFVTTSHSDSANIAKSLAKNHILVRSFDYAPDWIRFGLPNNDAAFARLEDALTHATKRS